MAELPPLTRDQRKVDADHLKLLAIFHFVGAGLALLGILFLFGHYMILHTVFDNPAMWKNSQQGPPPMEFFSMFKWFYLAFGIWFLIFGILNVLSGLFLLGRKHRMFSLVVGGINCVHIPFGMALGIFTIIVLLRDSVKEIYES
ncbi:MAG: hypothetical protein ABIP97_01105 [Chthoniobacterales bacterium]